jgi:hypothetical protein
MSCVMILAFLLNPRGAIMKLCCTIAVLLFILTTAAAFAQSDAQKAFDKLKSLAGTWEGKDTKGGSVEDTYHLTAGGTAVMGENKMGREDMLSLFYVDGDRLLMTHFCPSGNQPRMQATISADLKSISFDFLDITNLPNPQSGHMHHALYLFSDADHYTEAWTWRQNGKDATFQYEMQRRK